MWGLLSSFLRLAGSGGWRAQVAVGKDLLTQTEAFSADTRTAVGDDPPGGLLPLAAERAPVPTTSLGQSEAAPP